jgi:hypothetical protein
MNTISLHLPNSLHKKLVEIAAYDGISLNQFIAAAEKLSAMVTENYLQNRAKRSSLESFEDALSEIPDIEPEDQDKL